MGGGFWWFHDAWKEVKTCYPLGIIRPGHRKKYASRWSWIQGRKAKNRSHSQRLAIIPYNPNGILERTFWPHEFGSCFEVPHIESWSLDILWCIFRWVFGDRSHFRTCFWRLLPTFLVFLSGAVEVAVEDRGARCCNLAPEHRMSGKMWSNNRNSYSLQWKTSLTLGKMDEICHIRIRLENWVHQSDR